MCSKKVAGIALTATGVILIVVGVIVGVLLTNMAQKAIEDSTCVNSKDSSGYKRWVSLYITFNTIKIWESGRRKWNKRNMENGVVVLVWLASSLDVNGIQNFSVMQYSVLPNIQDWFIRHCNSRILVDSATVEYQPL